MANLFSYIDEIREVGGEEGLLEAGSPVMARTREGYEPLGTPLEEPTLVGALTAVLTSEQQVDLAVGNVIQFPVERPSGRWHVLIESTSNGIRVRMRGPSLDNEQPSKKRVASATPAVLIETPADSEGSVATMAEREFSIDTAAASDTADPFTDGHEGGSEESESSVSGLYEQPNWDVPVASEGRDVEASDAASGPGDPETERKTFADTPAVRHAEHRGDPKEDSSPANPAGQAGGALDPFLLDDDLDDEFEIEDPFADFSGSSTTLRAVDPPAVEEEDDLLDDARSPFDFDDEVPRGGTETSLEAQDAAPESAPALMKQDASEVDEEMRAPAGPAAEVSASPEEKEDPRFSEGVCETIGESPAHGVGSWEAVKTAYGAAWSVIGEGEDAGALAEPIPAGALCYLLGGVRLEGSDVDMLVYTDQEDEGMFRAASRIRVPGRMLCLDVEDPSHWLTWIGRRIEAGARVLIRSDATTAEGAWRSLVGLQSRSRAEAWFAEHSQYAIYAADDGYVIARRRLNSEE